MLPCRQATSITAKVITLKPNPLKPGDIKPKWEILDQSRESKPNLGQKLKLKPN
jgi:hypothetical protein